MTDPGTLDPRGMFIYTELTSLRDLMTEQHQRSRADMNERATALERKIDRLDRKVDSFGKYGTETRLMLERLQGERTAEIRSIAWRQTFYLGLGSGGLLLMWKIIWAGVSALAKVSGLQ